MGYSKTEGTYKSSNGINEIKYYVFVPDKTPFAILQISHGMCNYIEKYETSGFVKAMTDAGIVVCGNDHLGHGGSISNEEDIGYFENYHDLISDNHTLNTIIRKKYPSLPYILLGYSMGSFVVRSYLTEYNDIDGVILCSTGQGNQPLKLGRLLSKVLRGFKGPRYRSRLLTLLTFSSYNKSFTGEGDHLSWMTSDEAERMNYRHDKWSKFTFTVSAYKELFSLILEVTSDEWIEKVPLSLPVFLASGKLDALGDNGEGVKEIYIGLQDAELNMLKMKLYDEGRHDLFNDKVRSLLASDIVDWVKEVAEGVVEARCMPTFVFEQKEEI